MNINAPSINDIGINYIIRLSDTKMLVSRDKENSEESAETQIYSNVAEENQESKKSNSQELSEEEERVVRDLEARDTEVKAHEAAHQAAGGGLTGGASYSYQIGPDGKMYAIGGEVSINTPAASSPEEAVKVARQVITAAMAPSQPSPQDYAVAASARMMEIQAQHELAKEELEKQRGLKSYIDAQGDSRSKEQRDSNIDISA